jgi:hypothetical protein
MEKGNENGNESDNDAHAINITNGVVRIRLYIPPMNMDFDGDEINAWTPEIPD